MCVYCPDEFIYQAHEAIGTSAVSSLVTCELEARYSVLRYSIDLIEQELEVRGLADEVDGRRVFWHWLPDGVPDLKAVHATQS